MYLQKVLNTAVFSRRLKGQWRKLQDPDPDPDPLVRGTDPWIRIHTKMSRIRNTGISIYRFTGKRKLVIKVSNCPTVYPFLPWPSLSRLSATSAQTTFWFFRRRTRTGRRWNYRIHLAFSMVWKGSSKRVGLFPNRWYISSRTSRECLTCWTCQAT